MAKKGNAIGKAIARNVSGMMRPGGSAPCPMGQTVVSGKGNKGSLGKVRTSTGPSIVS